MIFIYFYFFGIVVRSACYTVHTSFVHVRILSLLTTPQHKLLTELGCSLEKVSQSQAKNYENNTRCAELKKLTHNFFYLKSVYFSLTKNFSFLFFI